MRKTGYYFPELDSLRFFAFLTVFIHHAPFSKSVTGWETLHRYGWIGVDIFLCLSAYLFAKLLFAEHKERGAINVRYFYLRRLLRIWPLYFAFLGAMLAYHLLTEGWNNDIPVRMLGSLTFTDNIFSAFLGYNSAVLYIAHLWTISYEEQVYLVIPWVLGYFYRQQNRTILILLTLAAAVGAIIRAILIHNQTGYLSVWVLPLAHFESVLGGLVIGLGLFDKQLKKIPGWAQLFAGLTLLYLVTALPNVTQLQWKSMLTYPMVGVGVSLVLSDIAGGGLGAITSLMKTKSLGYLGKISYGLYVYNIFAIELAQNMLAKLIPPERDLVYPVVTLITALILTILVSAISYELLEKPFQKIKSRFTFIENRST